MEYLSIKKIKPNPNNPRTITDENFEKLVKSVKEFPKMLELRPLVVDENMIVLGGNMRLKACVEAGMKKIPIVHAKDLTEEEKKRFVIADNVGFGDWNWEQLNEEWNQDELSEWGLAVWGETNELDYSILDDDDSVDSEVKSMGEGVKRAIQIEFESQDYETATELIKFWRERQAYIGAMIIEMLKAEKDKLK